MPGENILDWSVTAASNGTADSSINWAEGMARASVNDSARSMMAAHAKDRNLKNGSITTGGTANAQTFTSGLSYTSVPTGLSVRLKIGTSLTNTATATLNVDGIGDVTIKDEAGNALVGGELLAGSYRDFLYNGTNWILLARPKVTAQVFTVSGTWTKPAGCVRALVEVRGGGGGGGGVAANGGVWQAAGGGGQGGRSIKLVTAPGATETITIGAGGTAGANTGGQGGTGGTSSFGAHASAAGGVGGAGSGGTAGCVTGGAGGTGSSGNMNFTGQAGAWGGALAAATMFFPGLGGGEGGGLGSNDANGGNGTLGGGGGAAGTSGASGFSGGVGGDGYITVWEFY